jgi:hypothetical protein
MNAMRFDRISKLIAGRRSARRIAAQEATPAPPVQPGKAPELLFVQSFRAGAITAKEGKAGRYTLTLEGGNGKTIYFSDRPDRIVGANPTPDFLEVLDFPDDNPPNAALVFETAPGDDDVAVVELFSPVYDPVTDGVTYEVEVLQNWRVELGVGLQEAPIDLSVMESSFGTAHLFIDGLDDCPNGTISCRGWNGEKWVIFGSIDNAEHDGFCQLWSSPWGCWPCSPWLGASGRNYWNNVCIERFEGCERGSCGAEGVCFGGRDVSCSSYGYESG